jgi:prepilin-type N-terminal cleavage/methylation domain-containing protein
MKCAYRKNQGGFTLVEISIVMIIIGLLIGGTFGGMKLIENMQVNKTVQDLKAIESAALTFKDTYGRLPGDIVNPANRLPNCTVAPCATGGNGDRQISPTNAVTPWRNPINATWERFTFWHHLQAADLVTLNMRNSTDPTFGEGQPTASVASGYRMTNYTGAPWGCTGLVEPVRDAIIVLTDESAGDLQTSLQIPCSTLDAIDRKVDDGIPLAGRARSRTECGSCTDASYNNSGSLSSFWYDVRF